VLLSPEWDAAVRGTPRHVFVPSYVEQCRDGSWRTVSEADPETHDEWLAAVYSDRPLITALRTNAAGHATVISSSSKPGLMVRMLEALELRDEHRVLEIGTGTGYNVALLCSRLGADNVASVDVEPELVQAAEQRLAVLRFAPKLAVTDGADGVPEAAPFDRIIATCSVSQIPTAWVEQLTRRGRVLADLKVSGAAGNLVDLRATPTGLEGRFLSKWAGFMPLRSKGEPAAASDRLPQAIERLTSVASANPWWDDVVVWFLAALALPTGVTTGVRLDERSMTPVAATMAAADGSWAEVELGPDDDGRRVVRGSGADLWASVERAYALWHELGEPGWDSFGLTVTDSGQRVWFGRPNSKRAWPLMSLSRPGCAAPE
jgi:protein-L-isoaspartate O-methyltransferase